MREEQVFIRAFFAIDLPEPVKNGLGDLIAILKKALPESSIHWVKLKNLHVTLQFLEKIAEEDLEIIIEKVQKQLIGHPSFQLQLGPLMLFPTPYAPRIISLDVKPTLDELAMKIGKGILEANYPIETRPFKAHLTLARLKDCKKRIVLPNVDLPIFEKITIKEIILYKSEANSEGSQYTALHSIQF